MAREVDPIAGLRFNVAHCDGHLTQSQAMVHLGQYKRILGVSDTHLT